ncbi:MAG: Protein SprT [Fimbriimonadaceae bacterium]|nr:Protein SprT [Fimbriimonadaceae bacterium]
MQMSLFEETAKTQVQLPLSELTERLLVELTRSFPLKRRASLEWRNLRTTAGLADLKRFRIVLSTLVLVDAESAERTLKHEYAHLLAVDRQGLRGRGHGKAWKQAMRDLGEEPSVCHSYDCRRNVSRQVVTYRCAKCETSFDRRRRLPKGRRFLHSGCGGEVEFVRCEAL